MFINMMIMVFLLMMIIYLLFFVISYKMSFDMDSSSGYECGFSFISNTRMKFSYRFFLIGILFLIFDVEIVLMLSIPYLMKNWVSMVMMLMFIVILLMGLLYEYYCGSLEWM